LERGKSPGRKGDPKRNEKKITKRLDFPRRDAAKEKRKL